MCVFFFFGCVGVCVDVCVGVCVDVCVCAWVRACVCAFVTVPPRDNVMKLPPHLPLSLHPSLHRCRRPRDVPRALLPRQDGAHRAQDARWTVSGAELGWRHAHTCMHTFMHECMNVHKTKPAPDPTPPIHPPPIRPDIPASSSSSQSIPLTSIHPSTPLPPFATDPARPGPASSSSSPGRGAHWRGRRTRTRRSP